MSDTTTRKDTTMPTTAARTTIQTDPTTGRRILVNEGGVRQDGALPLYRCNTCGGDVVWATSARTGAKYLVTVSHRSQSGVPFYVKRDLHDCGERLADAVRWAQHDLDEVARAITSAADRVALYVEVLADETLTAEQRRAAQGKHDTAVEIANERAAEYGEALAVRRRILNNAQAALDAYRIRRMTSGPRPR